MLKRLIANKSLAKNLPTYNKIISRNFFTFVPENKEGVKLFMGKKQCVVKPGFNWRIPFLHDIWLVDIREKVRDIPKMQVISSEGVTFRMDASLQCKIVNSEAALLNVEYVMDAVLEKCKMELRDMLSSMEINKILSSRGEISNEVKNKLHHLENDWEIKIISVQIRDIEFDESIKKSMSVKAEADRLAEAKIINADADVKTAEKYNEAAKIYSENPITLRLREFQLWTTVSNNPNTTIYVVPSNLLDTLNKKIKE